MSAAVVPIAVDAAVTMFVRPAAAMTGPVVVLEHDAALDAPLGAAAEEMRRTAERAEVISAVRAMYRRFAVDPTKTRPSSEALLRRVRRGDPLPRINSLVDIVNWCSLETQLPFGLYDVASIEGPITARLGREGETYPGIRKDEVHLAGRLTLADDRGPFGNPTSDSARTMVTPATTAALVVVFVPASLPRSLGEGAMHLTLQRIGQFCNDAR